MPVANDPYVFISYSRKQYFIAKKLAGSLQAHPLSAWLDVEQISPGDDWQASLDRGLQHCQALVVLASRASYRSAAVRYEVNTARKAGKPIYLVVIEPCGFITELAGSAAIIDCRNDFTAAVGRLAQSLSVGQQPVEQVGRSQLLNWIRLPLGQTKLTQLLLLNACFLFGTIAWMLRMQVSLHWPIDPRIVPYLVMALTLIALWFVSFGYSIFLLFAFRYQRQVTYLELDLWPILCVFLFPMLFVLFSLRFETAKFVQVPGFGDYFNAFFSIQYRSGATMLIFLALFVGIVALFYLYLRYVYHARLLGSAAVVCAVLVLPSTISMIISVIGILVIGGGIAIWMLRETLTGKTIPIAFGTRDQRLAAVYEMWPRADSVWGKRSSASDTDRAWGFWLSPGAFFIDPLSGMRSARASSPVGTTRGKTWRLHYLPEDRHCAHRVRQILARRPALSEVTAGEASYEIAILSNRTPQRWIEALAAAHPGLIGVIVSAIDISVLPAALHQNQWIDYRRQQPEAIRRLAAVIAGEAEPTAAATPEDFMRPVGPYPFKLVSHALRITGFMALVLAGSALLIQRLTQVAIAPAPLIGFCFALGLWTIWSGSRILARNLVFAEMCALAGLNLLNVGLWASQGVSALMPRALKISTGPYNGSLTAGIGFIAAVIALPLVLFLLFGWAELLLHLRTLFAWLPLAAFARRRRTLAVAPWHQLDFAYIPYLLSCLILIATLVGDSSARYAPIQEFALPDQNTSIVSFVSGPDDNVWFATHTFSVTSNRSGVQTFQQDAIGYVTTGGTVHINRFILPYKPYCSSVVTADCPVYFAKDGSLAYLSLAASGRFLDPPSLTWLTAGSVSKRVQLPAAALPSSAVFDGAGNLWYMREVSKTQVAISRMDSHGQTTNYPYQPYVDIVAGRDGTIWLTDAATHSIIHVSTSGVVSAYVVPHLTGDDLSQLALGTDGTVWFYEYRDGIVGHMLPDGTFTFVPTSFQNTPTHLVVGSHNTIWLVRSSSDIAEYLSPTGTAKTFLLDQPASTASWFTAGSDGNLYYSLGKELGRITQHGDQRVYEIPTLNAKVQELVARSGGHLWFSEIPDTTSTANWSILGEFIP